MKFIQVDKKPEKDAKSAGKVDFVAYMVNGLVPNGVIYSLWPNGCTVNNRTIGGAGIDVQHVWDSVTKDQKLTAEFGIA